MLIIFVIRHAFSINQWPFAWSDNLQFKDSRRTHNLFINPLFLPFASLNSFSTSSESPPATSHRYQQKIALTLSPDDEKQKNTADPNPASTRVGKAAAHEIGGNCTTAGNDSDVDACARLRNTSQTADCRKKRRGYP